VTHGAAARTDGAAETAFQSSAVSVDRAPAPLEATTIRRPRSFGALPDPRHAARPSATARITGARRERDRYDRAMDTKNPPRAWLLGLVALAACESKVDTKLVEADIIKMMGEKNVPVDAVHCPANQSGKAGTTFQCTGKDMWETPATFKVTMAEGGKGNIELVGKYADMKKLGDSMEASYAARTGHSADITCPSVNIILKAGVKFGCDVKHDGVTEKLHLVMADDEGKITLDLPQGGADHAAPAHTQQEP
jgi:hypothetical protein